MNTAAAAHQIVADSEPPKRTTSDWHRDIGMLGSSVRLEVDLTKTSDHALDYLQWLEEQLPLIRLRVKQETEESRRLLVLQSELKMVRQKVGRNRR